MHAEAWQQNIEAKFPERSFKTTVMDTSGKNVFVTRYFKSIKPPPEVEAITDPDKAMVSVVSVVIVVSG